MEIKGLTGDEFRAVVERVSAADYAGNISLVDAPRALNMRGDRFRARIRASRSALQGARRTWTGRRSVAACWHAHRDVLALMFAEHPHAVVRTTFAVYRGAEGFRDNFPGTGRRNIGSAYTPVRMPELCDCDPQPLESGPYADALQDAVDRSTEVATDRPIGSSAQTPRSRFNLRESTQISASPAPEIIPADETPAQFLEREYRRSADQRHSHSYITAEIERYEAEHNLGRPTPPDHLNGDTAASWSAPTLEPLPVSGANGSICEGTLWVCVDCMILHANGEQPTDPQPGEPEPLSAIPPHHTVTAGLLSEEHHDGCAYVGGTADECECAEINFSSASCEGCGSHLAGERHALTLWQELTPASC